MKTPLQKFIELKTQGVSTEVALLRVWTDVEHRLVETVVPGGNPLKIPKPSCIDQYLPKNRPATAEEIRNAWHKCAND